MSLRMQIFSLLDRAGMIDLAVRAQRIAPLPFLRIVGYHRIGNPKVVARETDEDVVDVTAEDFERHVAFLARGFNIVGIDALRRYFVEKEPLPKNPAMITFDDGYRECLDIALPILKRHDAPGVFFVSTDHVARRKVFWWDRIAYLFKRTKKRRIELDYPKHVVCDLENDRARAIDDALSIVKRTYALDLDRYLDALANALDVPWTNTEEKRVCDASILGWDEIRALRRGGMDVQSHTATHRILQTLSDEDLEKELVGSKRALEDALDEKICAIAYPSGNAVGQHTKIGRAVRDAGYDIGFSGSGLCRLGRDTDPLDLHRISIDMNLPKSFYRASIALPPVMYRR